MPELPEVETCRLGLLPYIENNPIKKVIIRERRLRHGIPNAFETQIIGQSFKNIHRRGKYLLFETAKQTGLIVHLGMSGSLRWVKPETPPQKHDHVDIIFNSNHILRYHDPRRFGWVEWWEEKLSLHPIINRLGVEPLSVDLTSEYLFQQSRMRKTAVKNFLLDQHVIAGLGNIYVNEALFYAKIFPALPTHLLNLKHCQNLIKTIPKVLNKALKAGGTTLRNYVNSEGNPGYFKQSLAVYGREQQPCRYCKILLEALQIGQRQTVYCPHCQKI